MPCYAFYVGGANTTNAGYKKQAKVGEGLGALHEQTFGTPAAHVRVEFVSMLGARVGGVGFVPTSSYLKLAKVTEYCVAAVRWTGTGEEWQEYRRKIVELFPPYGKLRSVYLQKLECEFEVENEGENGRVQELEKVGRPRAVAELAGTSSASWP